MEEEGSERDRWKEDEEEGEEGRTPGLGQLELERRSDWCKE